MHALFQELAGRAHIDHLGGARIAQGAGAAHEQDRVLVDAELRVVDTLVIVLGPVEDDRFRLEGIGILGV